MLKKQLLTLMGKTMWKQFDADETTELKEREREWIRFLLKDEIVSKDTVPMIKKNAMEKLKQYKDGQVGDLNKTVSLLCFRPNEFEAIDKYDKALTEFETKFEFFDIPWQKGSEPIKQILNSTWPSAGDVRIDIGMDHFYEVDNFIKIDGYNVAVESETSNNLDNGITTINQFIHKQKADFGIIIVPWLNRGTGNANAKTVITKLDKTTEAYKNEKNPIFALVIFRKLDAYTLLSKMKEEDFIPFYN